MNQVKTFMVVVVMILAVAVQAFAASEARVIATDYAEDDNFGNAVSIQGDYAIVASHYADAGATDTGAAYVYYRTGDNTWDAGTKLIAGNAGASDFFGSAVGIDGDYVIVGAYFEDTVASNAGAAYLFHRTGLNTWDAGSMITDSGGTINDYFGWAVDIDGDYAIAGAYASDLVGSMAGAAFVFLRTGENTWGSEYTLVASDPQNWDFFGRSVAIDGNYAIVGTPAKTVGSEGGAGAAYIFHRTDTNTWDAGAKIVAADPVAGDNFGCAVGISGDYAIVGATYKETEGNAAAGAAYIFHRTGDNTWDAGTKIVAGDAEVDDWFGSAVALSGPYAMVGAYGEDGDGTDNKGAAYLFNRTGVTTWVQGAKLTASDSADNDEYGFAVSLYGSYAIAGASYDEQAGVSNVGSAYIYKHDLPAAVDLLAFAAEWTDAGAALSWTTGSETECGVFTLLRCALGDAWNGAAPPCAVKDYQELDLVIPCADSMFGAEYKALDVAADLTTDYAYLLREYETTGGVHDFGPVFLYSVKYGDEVPGGASPDDDPADPGDDDSGAGSEPDDENQGADDDESNESSKERGDPEEEDEAGCGL